MGGTEFHGVLMWFIWIAILNSRRFQIPNVESDAYSMVKLCKSMNIQSETDATF